MKLPVFLGDLVSQNYIFDKNNSFENSNWIGKI